MKKLKFEKVEVVLFLERSIFLSLVSILPLQPLGTREKFAESYKIVVSMHFTPYNRHLRQVIQQLGAWSLQTMGIYLQQ